MQTLVPLNVFAISLLLILYCSVTKSALFPTTNKGTDNLISGLSTSIFKSKSLFAIIIVLNIYN